MFQRKQSHLEMDWKLHELEQHDKIFVYTHTKWMTFFNEKKEREREWTSFWFIRLPPTHINVYIHTHCQPYNCYSICLCACVCDDKMLSSIRHKQMSVKRKERKKFTLPDCFVRTNDDFKKKILFLGFGQCMRVRGSVSVFVFFLKLFFFPFFFIIFIACCNRCCCAGLLL